MAKLTYLEQLKHPNWQRKRLAALESASFQCEECGDADKTLHVHHRRYVKGRMAWEYDLEDLAVLCEICHQESHFQKEQLNSYLALLCHGEIEEILGYAAGIYLRAWGDKDTVRAVVGSWEQAVGIADAFGRAFTPDDVIKTASRDAHDVSGLMLFNLSLGAGK